MRGAGATAAADRSDTVASTPAPTMISPASHSVRRTPGVAIERPATVISSGNSSRESRPDRNGPTANASSTQNRTSV